MIHLMKVNRFLTKKEKENMNKKYIKQAFSHEGIQLGKGAIYSIEYELKVQVSRMAKRCKDGNLKRLTPELFWVALGRLNKGQTKWQLRKNKQ